MSLVSDSVCGLHGQDLRCSFFADDVVLFVSLTHELLCTLGRFTAKSEAAGMVLSFSNFKTMVLNQKKVQRFL